MMEEIPNEEFEDEESENVIPCPYCQGKMVIAFGYDGVQLSSGDYNFRQGACDDCGMQTPRLTTHADVEAWVTKLNGLLKLH